MEIIYHGGSIITMEDPKERPEAVLVKNGIIAKVGTLEQVTAAAGKRAKKVDLKGKCLMPGFLDAHSHISMNGQMALMADLSECRCFEDIADAMRKFIKENKVDSTPWSLLKANTNPLWRKAEQP